MHVCAYILAYTVHALRRIYDEHDLQASDRDGTVDSDAMQRAALKFEVQQSSEDQKLLQVVLHDTRHN